MKSRVRSRLLKKRWRTFYIKQFAVIDFGGYRYDGGYLKAIVTKHKDQMTNQELKECIALAKNRLVGTETSGVYIRIADIDRKYEK